MVITSNHYRWDFIGLSTDSKPTPETSQKVCNGSTFYEADTSAFYIFYNDQWYLKQIAGTGTYYIPLTLAYISYGRGDSAQLFIDLMKEQGNAPVGGASYAFANTSDLTSLDLRGVDFSNVTDTVCMFDNASDLTSITWDDEVDMGNVETMEGMYRGTSSLTSVDLSKFNTSEYLESVFNMFAGSGVQSVNLGAPFDTSAVTDFYGMFNSCTSLTTINNLDDLDLSSAVNVGAMFYNCSSLTSLDLSDNAPDLSLSTANADYMLAYMTSLQSLDLSGWKSGSDDLASSHFWEGSRNLCPSTSGGFWVNQTTTSAGKLSGNSGVIIPVVQNTDYTISVQSVQARYRVAFVDTEPVTDNDSVTAYNGANADYTSNTLTVNSGSHSYLVVNVSNLAACQVEVGFEATAYMPYGYSTNLHTLTLNGNKRLVDGKISDSIMATFSSKQGNTITNLTINDPVYYTTDGTTAELTNLGDIWGGNALTTLEMTGWDLSDVDPAGNPASTSFNSLANLTTLTIGDFTLPTNGVNLAMIIGVENTGGSYTSGAPLLANLHLTGNTVMKVYNSGTGSNKSQNVFVGNPIGNGTGHIYVPANLVNSYKSDSFWSNYSAIIEAED